MRTGRVFQFLVRNWPLRLGALALAFVLYVGLVVVQNARVWPGQVPIVPSNQPAGTFLLSNLGEVGSIRYLAPADVAGQVSNQSFVATANLSGIGEYVSGTAVSVPVTVTSSDPRIQILNWDPRYVPVRLDPVTTRAVPVHVDRGAVPEGLTASDPTVDPMTVAIRGPASLVSQVSAAVARVTIDASGINVDEDVDLIAVDDRGDRVAPMNIDPSRAHVTILVGEQISSRTVPVVPTISGDLAAGYSVKDVQIDPVAVTVTGSASVIAALASVSTGTVDLTGKSADVTVDTPIAAPKGVNVIGTATTHVTVHVIAESGSRSFGAGVVLVGARSDRAYELSVPDVLVTLGGTRVALNAVDPATLEVTVDVTDLGSGTATLPAHFRVPAGTTLIAISPASVDVTVVIPANPTPTPSASAGP